MKGRDAHGILKTDRGMDVADLVTLAIRATATRMTGRTAAEALETGTELAMRATFHETDETAALVPVARIEGTDLATAIVTETFTGDNGWRSLIEE